MPPDHIHQPSIHLSITRCFECGRYYSVESARAACCPYCAQQKVDRSFDNEQKALRAVASLRGALTKAKARR